MKRYMSLVACLCLALFVAGCAAKTGNKFLENLSHEDSATFLIKGKTTKKDVQKRLGDPEEVDFADGDMEKWTYSFKRSSAKAINFVPYANLVMSGTNDTTTQLKILFDHNGVLKKYTLSKSSGETKVGAFQ